MRVKSCKDSNRTSIMFDQNIPKSNRLTNRDDQVWTLLDDEKIKYTKFVRDEGIVSLNLKPETTGQVTIIGTTVIPEFSMFIPLIMGFLIILTVPAMRKFSLR